MTNINNYDLFLFDLDGTLINTEEIHYQSYRESLIKYGYTNNFTFNDYCKICHLDDIAMQKFVETNLNIVYEKFYQTKKHIYLSKLNDSLCLINGFNYFLQELKNLNKKTCIVTHSSRDTIDFILDKLPILKIIDKIITKDDYKFRKPNPECYIKALTLFPECKNPIGFEDSCKGFLSLRDSNITSVFIGDDTYVHYKQMKPINVIKTFQDFNELVIVNVNNNSNVWINNKIESYTKYISCLSNTFDETFKKILPLIKSCKNNIYLTGIGKCGHICKKSISTWQSMGISSHYLNLVDLFHGDFGILRENDIIIYISNSGNTNELINCAKYVNSNFKVLQIALTINNNPIVKDFVDYNFVISDEIKEIDSINMAPTVSSVIFMMFLDLLGVYIAENNNITVEKFQLNHPGGILGKKAKNKIDYVVIVASGKGSRLNPLTKYIPKILVTVNNKPFIESLIEYWNQYAKNIIIIHNTEYKQIIQFYTNKYENINLIQFDELTGTADTINKTITNEYYNKNILFSWCDIIPKELINLDLINETTIFTYGNECRYNAEKNKISKKAGGNIVGLYYIQNYQGLKYTIGEDICDCFQRNFNYFSTYQLNHLIDIGDMDKFISFNFVEPTRFFNKIDFFDNYIIKSPLNEQGIQIIKKEINWYKFIATNNKYDFIPKFKELENNRLELEFLKAEPLYKTFKHLNKEDKQKVLDNIYNTLKILHSKTIDVKETQMIEDIHIESTKKIYERIEKIKPLLNYFGKINKVNGITIEKFDIIIEHMKTILSSNDSKYSLIHGDCQFSNILFDSKNIFLIDPRGYFGNTEVYGLPEYDYAKVLYALTGYDYFNNNNIIDVTVSNNEIIFNIDTFIDEVKYISNDKIKAWLVIIWFGLAQYNSNNVMKCLVSYYNGFYWYNKLFNT